MPVMLEFVLANTYPNLNDVKKCETKIAHLKTDEI